MNKSILESFIQKYTLGGICEKVTVKASKGTLTTTTMSENKDIVTAVDMKNTEMPDGQFSFYDTKKLSSMLAVLGDDMDVVIENDPSGNPVNMMCTSGTIVLSYVLADDSIIPKALSPKSNIVYELSFEMDDALCASFIKASSALKETSTYTIKTKGRTGTSDVLEFIIGDSSYTSNKIKFSLTLATREDPFSLKFATAPLVSVLMANKDAKKTLHICKAGLLKLECVGDSPTDYTATYYLFSVK